MFVSIYSVACAAFFISLLSGLVLGTSKSDITDASRLIIHPPTLPFAVNGLHSSHVMLMVSGYRKELMDHHARSFARHFHTVYMTEEALGHCVFCGDMDGGITFSNNSDPSKATFFPKDAMRSKRKELGWWVHGHPPVLARSNNFQHYFLAYLPNLHDPL